MNPIWIALLLVGIFSSSETSQGLKLINEWKSIDFNFPTLQLRQSAITRREFIPGQAVPIDVDVHYQVQGAYSKVFITFPRFREGIPMTLGTRSTFKSGDGSNVIDPYPDYNWHVNPTQDCNNRMISVFRIAIDKCNRLWVVDTGKIGLATSPYVCPPKILVFNLINNQLLHRYIIPQNQYSDYSFFVTPIVHVGDSPPGACLNSKAYIADVAAYGLLVYDSQTDSSWRVQNKFMYPYPTWGTHTISGESFELMDGIIGMDVDKQRQISQRSLYFHALASEHENIVPLSVLDNRTAWENDPYALPNSFKILGPKGSPSAASATDSNGNLFFGLNSMNAIACWNTKGKLSRNTIKTLIRDDDRLQFASGMKVIENTDGEEELWIVTNRFQKVFLNTMNNNEVNFRIQAQRIGELLRGGRCA